MRERPEVGRGEAGQQDAGVADVIRLMSTGVMSASVNLSGTNSTRAMLRGPMPVRPMRDRPDA